MLKLESVSKKYQLRGKTVNALDNMSLEIERGDFVSIVGQSGSGKSTLLLVLGGMLSPASGRVLVDGKSLYELRPEERATVRKKTVGFVFQTFNLLPRMSALKNVMLPLLYNQSNSHGDRPSYEERGHQALEAVGLGERLHHRPNELSGGQQQRVAIARALVTQPTLILADEPTGNLDSRAGEEIMAIFGRLNREGATIALVTHEPDIAAHARRTVRLHDGLIVSDEVRG